MFVFLFLNSDLGKQRVVDLFWFLAMFLFSSDVDSVFGFGKFVKHIKRFVFVCISPPHVKRNRKAVASFIFTLAPSETAKR